MSSESRRSWLWWPVVVAAFGFVLWSLAWCIADLEAFRARAWTEAWDNLARQAASQGQFYDPDGGDWESARRNGERAVLLAPLSSEYHEVLARVYVSRYLSTADGDSQTRPFLEQAAAEYREAIRLRPTWPYNYLDLAYALRRLDKLDDEYEQSLRMALHYGPWEPQVLSSVVSLNLDKLPRLKPSTRQLVLDTLVRGQAWTEDSRGEPVPYGDQIWGDIQMRHKELVVCSWLPMKSPLLKYRCNPSVPL